MIPFPQQLYNIGIIVGFHIHEWVIIKQAFFQKNGFHVWDLVVSIIVIYVGSKIFLLLGEGINDF